MLYSSDLIRQRNLYYDDDDDDDDDDDSYFYHHHHHRHFLNIVIIIVIIIILDTDKTTHAQINRLKFLYLILDMSLSPEK